MNQTLRLISMLAKTTYTLLLSCTLVFSSSAQSYEEIIDSLQQSLTQSTSTEQQVDLLNEISYSFRRLSNSKDSIFFYADQALRLANKEGYTRGQYIAYKNIGIYHYKSGLQNDSSKFYYHKSLNLAKQANDYYTQAACLNNLGLISGFKKDLSSSIKYYLDGVEILEKYSKENQSLKGILLGNLGMAYASIGDKERAYQYLKRTIEFGQKYNHKSVLSQYMDDYANILLDRGEIEQAEALVKKAGMTQKEIGDKQSQNPTLVTKIDLLISKGKFKEAKPLAENALSVADRKNYHTYASLLLNKLIEISIGLDDYNETLAYAQQLESMNKDLSLRSFQKYSYESLAKAYKFIGDYQRANENLTNLIAVSDTLLIIEQKAETAKLEAKFQLREQKAEIKALNKAKKAEEERAKLLTGTLILTILLISAIVFQLVRRNQKNKIIAKKNQELKHYINYNLQLENFAYIASHDLKTPLRNIVSFTQVLKASAITRLNEEEKNYLQFIEKGSKEMSLLLDDLYTYAQNSRKTLQVETINISSFFDNLFQNIDIAIKEKNAIVQYTSTLNKIQADPVKLNQLLQNLILNGLKFQKKGNQPIININLSEQGKNWLFKVTDNGIGIDEKFKDKIFIIFKRLHKKSEFEGTGIGLAICQKIVEQHGGKIWFNSTSGNGTNFFFTIPSHSQKAK